MSKKEKCLLHWSGAAEAAVALFELKSPEYRLDGLVCTRMSQGLSASLLSRQAESLELPIVFGSSPDWKSLDLGPKKKPLDGIAFTLLSSGDARSQLERDLSPLGLKAFTPLWGWDAKEVIRVFFSLGFKAVVTSVNLSKLPLPFVGREFDREFIDDLPSGVDPYGQNGEYETFVYDGPFFQRRIEFEKQKVIEKDGFGIQALA